MRNARGTGTGERARERRRRNQGATETARGSRTGCGARGFPSGGNVCRSGVPKRSSFPANPPKLRPLAQTTTRLRPRIRRRRTITVVGHVLHTVQLLLDFARCEPNRERLQCLHSRHASDPPCTCINYQVPNVTVAATTRPHDGSI